MHDISGQVIGSSGRTYVLNFGVNAMCRLEAITGRPYYEVMREVMGGEPRMETARHLMQAVLTDPATPSPEEAGNVLDDIGGIAALLAARTPDVGHG